MRVRVRPAGKDGEGGKEAETIRQAGEVTEQFPRHDPAGRREPRKRALLRSASVIGIVPSAPTLSSTLPVHPWTPVRIQGEPSQIESGNLWTALETPSEREERE